MEGGKAARKVMVIADATRESASALQYTISHAILDNDSLILLHVSNNHPRKHPFPFFKKPAGTNNNNNNNNQNSSSPNNNNNNNDVAASTTTDQQNVRCNSANSGGSGSIDFTFLDDMKKACNKALPQIDVTIEVVPMDAKDKANVILSQCSDLGIDLLVIGQRRTLSSAILGKQKRSGQTRGAIRGDTAEYLIENSKCTCVAVQKKGQHSGYLLNTKTHRDFWLLA